MTTLSNRPWAALCPRGHAVTTALTCGAVLILIGLTAGCHGPQTPAERTTVSQLLEAETGEPQQRKCPPGQKCPR